MSMNTASAHKCTAEKRLHVASLTLFLRGGADGCEELVALCALTKPLRFACLQAVPEEVTASPSVRGGLQAGLAMYMYLGILLASESK